MRKICALLCLPALTAAAPFFENGVIRKADTSQYINAYCQAARLPSGKLLVVYSTRNKESPDVRTVASLSTDNGKTWSEPRTLADRPGKWDGDPNIVLNGKTAFVYITSHDMHLKLIDESQTLMVRSDDEGATWSEPVALRMPRKYMAGKQHNGIRLIDGSLLMGISWDIWAERGTPARTEGEMNLVTVALRSTDGVNWTPFGNIHALLPKVSPFSTNGVCEPSIVELHDGEILMILRTGTSRHYESRSRDGGLTWSPPKPSSLTGHNTPTALWRLDQNPREIIAIWNNSPANRYPLGVAISTDGGRTWSKPRDVAGSDNMQASYPTITQTTDGTFIAMWQQQLKEGPREIRFARFNRDWVLEKP